MLDNKPELAMLNYYYGACRTENGYYSEEDLNYLKKANQEGVPAKIDYYSGVQNQALGNWDQAIRHYNRFRAGSSETEQTGLMLAEKIQQCFDHINPFITTQPTPTEISLQAEETTEATPHPKDTTSTTGQQDTKEITESADISQPTTGQTEWPAENKYNSKNPVNFIVNQNITYFDLSNFKTEEGLKLFNEGELKQKELDFMLTTIEKLRDEYGSARSEATKTKIGNKILSSENESLSLQEAINQLFNQSRLQEDGYWQNATNEEIEQFLSETEKHAAQQDKTEEPVTVKETQATLPVIISETEIIPAAPVENILPKQADTEELVYKVQIGAFSRSLPAYIDRLYKKLSLIRKIDNYTDEKGVVVYTTGSLTNLDDAIKLQKQVRQEGVQDAFVIAFYNGKRITLEQAKEIEKGL
ncbi:MAG: SPOR domain-containing protein [Bacteroidia bacterium]|nr:SPOR domain-containing protein [Bacteroidia bacterium]